MLGIAMMIIVKKGYDEYIKSAVAFDEHKKQIEYYNKMDQEVATYIDDDDLA